VDRTLSIAGKKTGFRSWALKEIFEIFDIFDDE
jgi:hypothetical protein